MPRSAAVPTAGLEPNTAPKTQPRNRAGKVLCCAEESSPRILGRKMYAGPDRRKADVWPMLPCRVAFPSPFECLGKFTWRHDPLRACRGLSSRCRISLGWRLVRRVAKCEHSNCGPVRAGCRWAADRGSRGGSARGSTRGSAQSPSAPPCIAAGARPCRGSAGHPDSLGPKREEASDRAVADALTHVGRYCNVPSTSPRVVGRYTATSLPVDALEDGGSLPRMTECECARAGFARGGIGELSPASRDPDAVPGISLEKS